MFSTATGRATPEDKVGLKLSTNELENESSLAVVGVVERPSSGRGLFLHRGGARFGRETGKREIRDEARRSELAAAHRFLADDLRFSRKHGAGGARIDAVFFALAAP